MNKADSQRHEAAANATVFVALILFAMLPAVLVYGQSDIDGANTLSWALNHSFSINTSSALAFPMPQPDSLIFPSFPEVELISNSSIALNASAFVFPCFFQASPKTARPSLSPTIFALCLTGVLPYQAPSLSLDGYPAITWRANGLTPAFGATISLILQQDGDLVLRGFSDSGVETVAWRSETSGMGVTRMELSQQPADLILYDANNISVWQSSNFPADTLTYGQSLNENLKLVSFASSTEDKSARIEYSLEINRTARLMTLFFKKHSSSQAIPYWSVNGTSVINAPPSGAGCGPNIVLCNAPPSLMPPPSSPMPPPSPMPVNYKSEFSAFITDQGLSLGSPAGYNNYITIPGLSYSIPEQDLQTIILRLDGDGSLRLLSIRKTWVVLADLFSGENACLLPLSCGTYGVCVGASKQCRCSAVGNDVASSFVPVNADDPSKGCRLALPLPTCDTENISSVSSQQVQMKQDAGAGYFSTLQESVHTISNISSGNSCSDSCLLNCTCLAALWNLKLNACSHIAEEQIGSFRGVKNSTDTTVYIKVGILSSPAPSPGVLSSPNHRRRRRARNIAIGVSVGTGYLFITSIFLLIFWIKRRHRKGFVSMDDDVTGYAGMLKLPLRYSYNDVLTATNGFSHMLGKGGFGSVYAGVLADGTTKVAVKKLERITQGEKEFKTELAIMGGIHHYNLLPLMGYCAEGEDRRLLVYKYMENGSLDQWLFASSLPGEEKKKHATTRWNWSVRYGIAVGVAKGLAYLHEECDKRIIHLDIKPQNILLDEGFVAKVADFGLSKGMEREESHVVTTMRGTPGYLAPEWLRDGTIDVKCDVFSYGMLLMEIVSGRKNYDMSKVEAPYYIDWAYSHLVSDKWLHNTDMSAEKPKSMPNGSRVGPNVNGTNYASLHSASVGKVDDLTDAVLESEEARVQVLRLIVTAFLCVLERPEWRPSMSKVVQMLEGQISLSDVNLSSLHQGLIFVLGAYNSSSSGSHGHGSPMVALNREFDEQLEVIRTLSSFPTSVIDEYSQVSAR